MRGGQAALDDGQVADRQMAVEVVHVGADLDAAWAGSSAGSMRGPATTTIRSPGTARWAAGNDVDHPAQQGRARRPSPPTVTMQTLLVGA